MAKPEAKPWPCGRITEDGEKCQAILGHIIRGGELAVRGGIFNTDGVNVILLCPECGAPKTWFPQPNKIIAAFGKAFAEELLYHLKRAS